MNKSERLSDMMIYLNGRSYFNLKDIIDRYHISRSTALRDIRSLEAIGMPIFTEHGRNGRYGILKNKLLSPIIFTVDEVYALYFAMLTLNGYQTTPFHFDLALLKKKFESCLSDEHLIHLDKMGRVFSLEVSKHPFSSPYLKEILDSCITEEICLITYRKRDQLFKSHIRFLNISSSFGQWYAAGYQYETKKIQVFRCDRIESMNKDTAFVPAAPEDLNPEQPAQYKQADATDFEVYTTARGIDLFYKEHYPSMQLDTENEAPVIRGYYNNGEERFIADYFSTYGTELLSIKPAALKQLIIDRCNALSDYIGRL